MVEKLKELFCDALFWTLLVLDLFAACFWVASQLSIFLTRISVLSSERGLLFAPCCGALLTLGILLGFSATLKHSNSR